MMDSNELIINLNDFRILQKIGESASWNVFLIENKTSKKQYVSKVNKIKCDDSNEQKKLINQAEIYIKAKYPTILHFIGYNLLNFDSEPYPTFITEYLPKGSLQQVFNQTPNLLTNTSRYIILLGTVLTIKHLHSLNIIHQDLKPSNILLDDHFYPRICDFGLSAITQTDSKSSAYKAPEVLSGNPYTFKSDIYSLALISYELITSKQLPIEITEIPGKDNQLFINRCLSPDPAKRPTISDILIHILHKSFTTIFNPLDLDEITTFLTIFNKNGDSLYALAEIQSENGQKPESIENFQLASEKGNFEAMSKYARILYTGDSRYNVSPNKKEALNYLKISASKNCVDSILFLASLFESGDGFVTVNKKEAVKYYRTAAGLGSREAMTSYAAMLQTGEEEEGVTQNKKEAAKFYRMAADLGDDAAMFNLATMLKKGDGVDVDKPEAARLYRVAADLGDPCSMNSFAFMAETGDGVEIDKGLAVRYYRRAAKAGYPAAMFNLANAVMCDDLNEAVELLKEAASKGCLEAAKSLACMMYAGDKVEQNKEEAARYYKMSADLGDTDSMRSYAFMLENGEGVASQNKEEASRYYKMAADLGDVDSMRSYAFILYNGDGASQNKEEASRYYKMAADLGDVDSMRSYAFILYNGDGAVAQNKEEASRYYKMAADLGDVDSMRSYAFMLENGDGVSIDREAALRYAAMADEIRGQFIDLDELCGRAYALFSGQDGVAVDKREAARLYREAADLGSVFAASSLAFILYSGDGVEADKREAAKYYRVAADGGDCDAMRSYAFMLENGEGVAADHEEAARYMKMADECEKQT